MEKRILLIIGGGIAAYKAPELIRQLRAQNFAVRCLATAAATQFVAPLSLASVSGDKVYENLFDLTDEAEMGHIQLSRDADMIVVAPATADLIARMAQGMANDLAGATLLATDKPVLIAPAMNVRMWEHPATQRNIEKLRGDGIGLIGPEQGDMACGEFGPGRMSEPTQIADWVVQKLHHKQAEKLGAENLPLNLEGRKILVTAGPTREPIDPVRYIANHSSGKQGYALAAALADYGAEVVLVCGPTQLADPPNVEIMRVETAQQMLAACEAALPVDAAIMAAAVADWRPAKPTANKLKKSRNAPPTIKLVENPDILACLASHKKRPRLLVGFAAETEQLEKYGRDKLKRKKCDWIMANNVSPASGVLGGDHNEVVMITEQATQNWPRMSKTEVANKLASAIAETLHQNSTQNNKVTA